MQGLVAAQDRRFGTFLLQGLAQLAGGLGQCGLHGIERAHGGDRGRCWLAIGFRGAPACCAVTLGGQQVVEVIQGQQLTHPGAFPGDQAQLVAVVLADHPQAAQQRQDKQQEQQLKLAGETETPKQSNPRC